MRPAETGGSSIHNSKLRRHKIEIPGPSKSPFKSVAPPGDWLQVACNVETQAVAYCNTSTFRRSELESECNISEETSDQTYATANPLRSSSATPRLASGSFGIGTQENPGPKLRVSCVLDYRTSPLTVPACDLRSEWGSEHDGERVQSCC